MIKWMIFLLALQIFTSFSEGEDIAGDPLEEEYGTLKHSSILFRHGNRSPLSSFPLDRFKNYPWPNGYGQLLNAGKQRLFSVGKGFRNRYKDFVNSSFVLKEIRVDSSSVDRCIMSAQCFLFGFYPAAGDQVWMEEEKWQPIPLHTIPANDDNMILQKKPCKLRKIWAEQDAANPIYETVYNDYKSDIEFMLNKTGIVAGNKTKAKIFQDMRHAAATLDIYIENNFTLTDFEKDLRRRLNEIVIKTIDNKFSLPRARIDSGPFLESVVKDMDQKMKEEKDEQKLHLYSGHDTTIRNILIALKVYDGEMPPYGSSLILELREKNSANYVTVTYSYRKSNYESDWRLLDVPGCGLTCTYEQFYNLTKPLIPENWDSECESTSRSRKFTMNAIIVTVLVHLSYLLK